MRPTNKHYETNINDKFRYSSVQALQQAMALHAERIMVLANLTNAYNEYGRPVIKKEIRTIIGAVQPRGQKRFSIEATGDNIKAEYTLTTVYPYKVKSGEYLVNTRYGTLRVLDDSNKQDYGTNQYPLEHINSIPDIPDDNNEEMDIP